MITVETKYMCRLCGRYKFPYPMPHRCKGIPGPGIKRIHKAAKKRGMHSGLFIKCYIIREGNGNKE